MSRQKSVHQVQVEALMNGYRNMAQMSLLPSRPTIPPGKMIEAQARIILEEFLEVMEACGCTLHLTSAAIAERAGVNPDCVDTELPLIRGEITVEWDGDPVTGETHRKLDIAEVAKELADLSVVTTGMFAEFGIADTPILDAVDTNNLAKLAPGCYLDENRKLRKPPNHPKPDIKTILVSQGWVSEVVNEPYDEIASVSDRGDKQSQ